MVYISPIYLKLEELAKLGDFASGGVQSFISNKVSPYSSPDKEGKRVRMYQGKPLSSYREVGENLGMFLRNPSLWFKTCKGSS